MYDQEVQPKDSASVSMEARVYRVVLWNNFSRVVYVHMSKIDSVRSLLEECLHRLTHSSHHSEYAPLIYSEAISPPEDQQKWYLPLKTNKNSISPPEDQQK